MKVFSCVLRFAAVCAATLGAIALLIVGVERLGLTEGEVELVLMGACCAVVGMMITVAAVTNIYQKEKRRLELDEARK